MSTLEKMNGSYVSDDLRDREDDIIWRVRWGEDWLYVYLLLEFQSTVDKYMALRIMVYVGRLYQDLLNTGKIAAGAKLPPVLPVVLYNGQPRWSASLDINDLIEELKPLKNLVAALFRLENSSSHEDILDVITTLLKWLSGEKQSSLHQAFTVWFCRVFFPVKGGVENLPAIEGLEGVRTMLAERVKEWTSEWEKKGRTKGRKEGEALLLQRQLQLKFGSLSSEYLCKIKEADSETLLLWSERILTATSIEEMFAS